MLETTGATRCGELLESGEPVRDVRFANSDEAEQRVVHLLGVAGRWPGLVADAFDGGGVESSELARVGGQGATE